jgi:hypothetical protein
MHHVTRGYSWIAGQRPYRAGHQRQGFCVVHLGAQCGDIPWWNSDTTPPSQFRGLGSAGSDDGLVPDVPPQTGMDLGCIGTRAGETIDITSAFSARVTIYLTVVTSVLSNVTMPRRRAFASTVM